MLSLCVQIRIKTLGEARLSNAELLLKTAINDACLSVRKKRIAPPDTWVDQQTNAELFPVAEGAKPDLLRL